MKPTYAHDCPSCVLIGQLTASILGDPTKDITWDFYLCQKIMPSMRNHALIARYGPDKAYLASLAPITHLAPDTTKWPLNVAAQLALSRRTA